MAITKLIARHIREIYFGDNWTCSNLKDNLKDVTWDQAVTRVHAFNTIATLVYHTNYYTEAIIKVLDGGPLIADDEFSFNHPSITNQAEWDLLLEKVWRDADALASKVEQLPDEVLTHDFAEDRRYTYYRYLNGNIEHLHYHLGQIALIKRMVQMQVVSEK